MQLGHVMSIYNIKQEAVDTDSRMLEMAKRIISWRDKVNEAVHSTEQQDCILLAGETKEKLWSLYLLST